MIRAALSAALLFASAALAQYPAKPVRFIVPSSAGGGIGTSPHMAIELLKSMAKLDMVHVPYKGTGPGVTDLLGGQVALMAPNVLTALPHIKAGKLRALGVTSARRSQALAEVPAIGEVLPGYAATQWDGVLAPAGAPPGGAHPPF